MSRFEGNGGLVMTATTKFTILEMAQSVDYNEASNAGGVCVVELDCAYTASRVVSAFERRGKRWEVR